METKINIDTPIETEVNTIRYNGEEIAVYNTVGFGKMLMIVGNVFEGTFGDNGEYMPELTDFYTRKEIIEGFTDIQLSINPADTYNILYNSNLFKLVTENIDQDQLTEILKSIDKKIVHKLRTNESQMKNKFEEMINNFSSIGDTFEEILNSKDIDIISESVRSVLENGIDEGVIAKAYIDGIKGAAENV